MSGNDQDQTGDLLLREVDEDLRREHYLLLWRAYGKYAVAALVAIILGVALHQVWQSWRAGQFQTEAARYQAAEELLAAGKQADGLAKLAEIAKDPSDSFALVAGFRRAALQIEAGDEAGAVATYESLSHSDAPPAMRDLAILKSALLVVEKEDPAILAQRLQPLTDPANPWHYTATELLALLAERRGDQTQAAAFYKQLADDSGTPQNIRSRATEMLTLLGGAPQPGKPEKG